MRGVNSCKYRSYEPLRLSHFCFGTHRHVSETETVEHVLVIVLELTEVDVLFDALVLGTKLGETSRGMDGMIHHGREKTMGRPFGSCA